MASRDSDISTNISSVTSGTAPVGMDFSSMTLEEEALANGWTRITKPVGNAEPKPTFTAGTRGEMGMDADNTLAPNKTTSMVTDKD